MKTWREALRDGAISGGVASILSTAVLSARGEQEEDTPYGPTNAISHWFWGDRAAHHDEPSARYTAVGYAIHHASATLWAVLYEKWFGERAERGEVMPALAGAAAVAGLACFVDYKMTPERLQPGFEKKAFHAFAVSRICWFWCGARDTRTGRLARCAAAQHSNAAIAKGRQRVWIRTKSHKIPMTASAAAMPS